MVGKEGHGKIVINQKTMRFRDGEIESEDDEPTSELEECERTSPTQGDFKH